MPVITKHYVHTLSLGLKMLHCKRKLFRKLVLFFFHCSDFYKYQGFELPILGTMPECSLRLRLWQHSANIFLLPNGSKIFIRFHYNAVWIFLKVRRLIQKFEIQLYFMVKIGIIKQNNNNNWQFICLESQQRLPC